MVQEKKQTKKQAIKETKQTKRKQTIENNFQKILFFSLKIVREINLGFVKTNFAYVLGR